MAGRDRNAKAAKRAKKTEPLRSSRSLRSNVVGYIGRSSQYSQLNAAERLYHGAGASQSYPISPIGAPGGASGAANRIGLARSSGRSRNRLMSAAISVRCAVSSSDF